MSDDATLGPPPKDGSAFRAVVGFLCIFGGLAGFFGLYFVEVPAGNRDALMLALGLVMGWGSAVVQSEYGASTTGRKAADATIKRMEKNDGTA